MSSNRLELESMASLEHVLDNISDRLSANISVGALRAMLAAVRMIADGKQPSIGEIAAFCGVSRQTVSRWVAHHVDNGWIKLTEDHEDGRERRISVADTEIFEQKLSQLGMLLGSNLTTEQRHTE